MEDIKLKEYYNYDEADLAANRRGVLTEKQRRRLARDASTWKKVTVIAGIGVVIIALLPIVILGLVGAFEKMGWLGALWGIWTLGWGYIAYRVFRSGSARPKITLLKTEGPVNIVKSRQYNSTTHQNVDEYELHVGGVKFDEDSDVADLLMQGDVYAVYYLSEGNQILSLELLSRAH